MNKEETLNEIMKELDKELYVWKNERLNEPENSENKEGIRGLVVGLDIAMNIVNKYLKKKIYTASDYYKPTKRNHCYMIKRELNPHLKNNPISIGDTIKIKYQGEIIEIKIKSLECTKGAVLPPALIGIEIEE